MATATPSDEKGTTIRKVERAMNKTEPKDLKSDVSEDYSRNVPDVLRGPAEAKDFPITVVDNTHCCGFAGKKTWAMQKNDNVFLIQGTLPANQKQHVFDLKNPEDNTLMKVRVARGLCRNDYWIEDTQGQMVGRSLEPTMQQRFVNLLLGSFVGYTVLTGIDRHDDERWVIRLPGTFAYKKCSAACRTYCHPKCASCCDTCTTECDKRCMACQLQGCGPCCQECKADCLLRCKAACDCKTKCLECKAKCMECLDCKAKCMECKAKCMECKAKCAACPVECKAKCMECKLKCTKCAADCKVTCTKCAADCKVKCADCAAMCKTCNKSCLLGCTCIIKPFHEEIKFWRPWDLEPDHWVTKIEFDGQVNACGMALPGYTIKCYFPEGSDIVDRAVLVALALYCDCHLMRMGQCCPAEPVSKDLAAK